MQILIENTETQETESRHISQDVVMNICGCQVSISHYKCEDKLENFHKAINSNICLGQPSGKASGGKTFNS